MLGEFCLNTYKIMDQLYKLNFKSKRRLYWLSLRELTLSGLRGVIGQRCVLDYHSDKSTKFLKLNCPCFRFVLFGLFRSRLNDVLIFPNAFTVLMS